MRHNSALVKNLILSTVAALSLSLTSARSGAQVLFDGLDWTTDRGGVVIDSSAAGTKNIFPQRQGYNAIGNAGTPDQRLDAHRGVLRWAFPRIDDLTSVDVSVAMPSTTIVVDNPVPKNLTDARSVWDKSDTNVFYDSTQPFTFPFSNTNPPAGHPNHLSSVYDAKNLWLPQGGPTFVIPDPIYRTGFSGFGFNFTPSDPTVMNDPFAGNPPAAVLNDYGITAAVHNDFLVNRGKNTTSPATAAELSQFPIADPAVYRAVHNVLVNEYNNQLHPIAQWTIGQTLNYNFDTQVLPAPDPLNPTYIHQLVPFSADPALPALPLLPSERVKKFTVDIYSPGSGTQVLNAANAPIIHPNVQSAFVRVSWQKTINPDGTVNTGTGVANAGGINDPVNSRIYLVDLSQPGWIHLGAPNTSPASFPSGGTNVDGTRNEIVVTLFSVTPDNVTDPTVYSTYPLVTADACQFIEQDQPALPNPDPTVPVLANGLGPLNDPLNQDATNRLFTFVGQSGRFLGPIGGTNKFTTDPALNAVPNGIYKQNSTLWYCVREEIVPNQARINQDPTQAPDTTANPLIIDPASTGTAPVFYCLTNENNVVTPATSPSANDAVVTQSKLRVVWRYVGYPDGGSATSFASPVFANVKARDGKIHTMVYFCGTSNTELSGSAGRIYALDALGDTNTLPYNPAVPNVPASLIDQKYDATRHTTVTKAYWTYPSIRPLEKEEILTPTGTLPAGSNTFANQYHDPNYTHALLTDPEGLYPQNDPTKYLTGTPGFWWAADQPLFATGSKQYYDGDLITASGNIIAKSDTQIQMGGISGSPVVLTDPSNPTGPMILVVPSLDGRMYAFDAGGRGDFDTTKALPTPPVDPTNPNVPPGTPLTLGINYAIPGTTQRLWTWPHYSADAFHQTYDMVGSTANAGTANVFQSEASKGYMPYSPAYDEPFGPADPRNPLVVSAGTPGEEGLPGAGHVYGVLPLHDAPVYIGQNNIPNWTVPVNAGGVSGTTDRRYWSYPFENNGRATDTPSATPLVDIPSVPTIFQSTGSTGTANRFAYFTSGGRIYSINLPNAAPPGGHFTPALNWVFPHTPDANIPNQDPTDPTTFEYTQGFAAKGLLVAPGAMLGINSITNTATDTVYGLLTDGSLIALEANPTVRPAPHQTNFISANVTRTGSFTESAPTLMSIARDPFLDAAARVFDPNTGQLLLTTSRPTVVFADDSGQTYGYEAVPRTYPDGLGGQITILPLIYQSGQVAGQVATPVAIAASTQQLPAGAVPPSDAQGHPLISQPYFGGYFVAGSTNGQLYAYSLGRFVNGFGDTGGNDTPPQGGGRGLVSIDIRAFDAFTNYAASPKPGYQLNEFDRISPTRGQAANGMTPGRKENGQKYANTATPIAGNIPESGSSVGLALDQGGNLYLAASGVYHAQVQDPNQKEYGTDIPTLRVTFNISQNGLPLDTQTVTLTPVTINPNNKGVYANQPWPDDLAITAGDKANLSIFGVDDNNPSNAVNPYGDGSAPQKLTGPAQNVYPWVAKKLVQIIPRSVGGGTTFGPSTSGYTVSVSAVIEQHVHVANSGNRAAILVSADANTMRLGQRYDQGMSQSEFPPDANDPSVSQSPQRNLYITNPLSLTVRSYNNLNDMTGKGPLDNPNMIGWAGAIDNPNVGTFANALELVGNGAYVGIGSVRPGTNVGGTLSGNVGFIKPIFAPFGMAQDNSSITYQVDNNGTKQPGINVMDRSDLARVTGQPVRVRARTSPFSWIGGPSSIMNPLPFDQLPDPATHSVDYPPLDSQGVRLSVNNVDITQSIAALTPPVAGANNDPSLRTVVPTPVDFAVQIPKYFPANVNRGQLAVNFRGKTISIGDTFTNQAGYAMGYSAGNLAGTADKNPIVGPLDVATGVPLPQTGAKGGSAGSGSTPGSSGSLAGSSPSGGYIGNVTVIMVPPGANNSGSSALGGRGRGGSAGLGGFFRSSGSGQIDRIFQTGVSVAPAFRMRVLEDTLDMGDLPHGTGYSDLVGGQYYYRFPFAPSGTGPYQGIPSMANPNGQILYSPWDNDSQFTPPATGINGIPNVGPSNGFSLGRFFRPFTLVNDSNVNLDKVRVAKLIGPHTNDTGANPDLSGIINNFSLSLNPGYGIANSVRLNSDQVNNLLSPPLFAVPFGQKAPGGGNPDDHGFLGSIGLVSSYDHGSYAQNLINEVNLYPMLNPAMDANAAQEAQDLYSLGLFEQDLYAKGAGLPWAVGIQGRPTLHKPRPGDSNGSVATVPDQPYEYQLAAQNNNPTNSSFYQQEVAAGLFQRPSVAIAVPMGTPVGTYTAKILPYEDGLPIQWLEWLSSSDSNVNSPTHTQYLGNEDDILNTNTSGAPTEPYAITAPTLKLTVRESRLTNGVTAGVMPQIDLRNTASGSYDPLGFNLQPSAFMVPSAPNGNNFFNKIMLYWTTNRVLPGSQFGTPVNGVTLPNPIAPLNIAYSSLYTPYNNLNGYIRGDAQVAGPVVNDNSGLALPQWWKLPSLLPGFADPNTPDNYKNLFDPQSLYPNINGATVRYGSPATTLATHYIVGGGFDGTDYEAYLFAQGTVDFLGQNAAGANTGQQTINRTFYTNLANASGSSIIGEPDYGAPGAFNGLLSFDNDPRVPKLSPRPLLVKIQTGAGNTGVKYLYVFWHSGSQGRTSLFYNVNIQDQGLGTNFPPAGPSTGFNKLGDQKLPSPAALTWQSDPYPVFRRAFDPTTNQMVNAIDVMFTGVLKNRQNVEILMARYRIVDTAVPANGSQPALLPGQLIAIPFPTVHVDEMQKITGTNTWAGRDAAWFLPSDTQTSDTATNRFMRVYLQPRPVNGIPQPQYPINGINGQGTAQRGRVDPASGLVYFNATAIDPATNNVAIDATTNRPIYGGGQIVVDSQSGTVTFPNIPPGKQDHIFASYTPYIMRINTSRNDTNVDRDISDLYASNGGPVANGTSPFGIFGELRNAHGVTNSPGQNYAPTMIMDRAANMRSTFQSPQVLFGANGAPLNAFNNNGALVSGGSPPIDRMWALYRQSDPAKGGTSTIYMKAMRLVAKLPRPVALAAVNGTPTSPLATQRIAGLVVERYDPVAKAFTTLRGGYEVDWVRGRVYFQEEDEGDIVHIRYTFFDPSNNQTNDSGDLYYRVAWGDEINSTGHPYDGTSTPKFTGDETTSEVQMPTTSKVNEGQVAAFKDAFIDKLWVFWSSTRAGTALPTGAKIGTTDLYYETLAPQFYPQASNQY